MFAKKLPPQKRLSSLFEGETTQIAEEAAEEVYEVEAITDKRYDDDGTVLYRVAFGRTGSTLVHI